MEKNGNIITAKIKFIELNKYDNTKIRFHVNSSFDGVKYDSKTSEYISVPTNYFDKAWDNNYLLNFFMSFFSYGEEYASFYKKKNNKDIGVLELNALFSKSTIIFERTKNYAEDNSEVFYGYNTRIIDLQLSESVIERYSKILPKISNFYIENNLIKINDTHICVIKKQDNSEEIELDYVLLDKMPTIEYNKLNFFVNNPKFNLQDLEKYVQSRPLLLNIINSKTNYCHELNEAYGCHFSELPKSEDKNNWFDEENHEGFHDEIEFLKKSYQEQVLLRIIAYDLSKTLFKCKQNKSYIACSHRETGFQKQAHYISDNIEAKIETNFGYGSASYFKVILKYKNLIISPYSLFVEYRKYGAIDVLSFWRSYDSFNSSWRNAFSEIVNAHNLAVNDEEQFLEIYVKQECNKMIEILETFVTSEQFSFQDYEIIDDKFGTKSRKLLIEKASKISSSISFISHILEFEEIVKLTDCVLRIESCNEIILPQVILELSHIGNDIIKSQKACEKQQDVLLPYELELEKYLEYNISLEDANAQLINGSKEKESILLELTKQYIENNVFFQNELKIMRELVSISDNLIEQQQTALDSISKINNYFSRKNDIT